MVKFLKTQIRRLEVVTYKLRRKLYPAPSSLGKKRGYYWSADRFPSRPHDFRRRRGPGQQYDGVDA